MNRPTTRAVRRPSRPTYPMCVDCGRRAHKNTLLRGAEWPCRCARCWEMLSYPHIACERYEDGESIPDSIFEKLFEFDGAACVDCGLTAHENTLHPSVEWHSRCARCWEMRTYPAIARQRYDAGEWIPGPIYNDLLEIETDELGGCEDADEGGDPVDDGQFNNDELMVAEPSWMTDLPQNAITPDIEQLVAEAFSPFEDRARSFWEWLTDFDVRGAQMAQKLASAKNAQALLRTRKDLIADMTEMFQSATDLRRRQLEAFLNELTLKEQIAEKLALTGARLATLKAIETTRRQKLLEAPPEPVSRSQQVVGEHREELQARAAAQRAALADFRSEVAAIIDEDIDDGQKAHELRAVLESYRLPENALPKRVRQFLANVDGEAEP